MGEEMYNKYLKDIEAAKERLITFENVSDLINGEKNVEKKLFYVKLYSNFLDYQGEYVLVKDRLMNNVKVNYYDDETQYKIFKSILVIEEVLKKDNSLTDNEFIKKYNNLLLATLKKSDLDGNVDVPINDKLKELITILQVELNYDNITFPEKLPEILEEEIYHKNKYKLESEEELNKGYRGK